MDNVKSLAGYYKPCKVFCRAQSELTFQPSPGKGFTDEKNHAISIDTSADANITC